jgi:fibro-slime domain-containing protein
MRKQIRSLIVFLVVTTLGLLSAHAQPPTDNLNGKTIHIYVESDNFNAFYFQNGDIAFKKDSKYNYSLTLIGQDIYKQDFFFTSNGTAPDGEHFKWKFGQTGLNANTEGRYKVSDFQGKKEMWIIVDPAGPVTDPPIVMFEAPKTINILNPWSTTAPKIISGTKTRKMTTTPGRCGWFTSLLLDPTMTKVHFAEVSDADTFGKGGFSSVVDYDLAVEFAAKGASLWLNTESNTWTGAWPNLDGDCQYLMAATVRDFSKDHPDFEFPGLTGDFLLKGMVEPGINPVTRKPVRSAKATTPPVTYDTFDSWWNTDTTNAKITMRGYESCVDIPMSKSSDGLWEYDSYRDSPVDHSFFPVEGTANRFNETMASCYVKPPPDSTSWVTGGPLRNGNFCLESHATFIYQPGQKFAFRGDDDVWVYIDDKLVVDLGGVHTPKSDSIDLSKLSLVPNKEYKWDFFYCDRQPCGSSLRVKTSIFFKQQRSLFKEEVPGATGVVRFKIKKREGGKGSCGSVATDTTAKDATNLTYQLLDASGKIVKVLTSGVSDYPGIVIATPEITVDPNTVVGLTPGVYRIVAFEPANEKVRVEIPFTIPSRNIVEIISSDTSAQVGNLVMVIASNREKGLDIPGIEKYTPTIPVGLEVYEDQARAKKVVPGSQLLTDATGKDTLWATGTATATTDIKYTVSIPLTTKSAVLTFIVPKNRVEFQNPLSVDTLVGSLVALNAANLDNGVVLAKAETYSLLIPPGLMVYADAAKTLPILSGVALTTDVTGLDMLFATADSTDLVDKTYILEIVGSAKKVTLKFRMPPLVLPKVISATMFDDDGDGIADRMVAVYDRDITGSLPKQVGIKWPSTAGSVGVAQSEIPSKVEAGKNLVLKGKYSTVPLTIGPGTFISIYQARKLDSTQETPIVDGIGPILTKAELALGKTEDTLRLTFSEPTSVGSIKVSPKELFSYKGMPTEIPINYDSKSLTWNADGTMATLVFDNTVANIPHAGSLVRIEPGAGHIVDQAGNNAGPASRFRVINGPKRSAIQTVTYRIISPDGVLLQENRVVPSLQSLNAVVAEVVERTGRMGHLIKTDLGSYAVKDDFSNVDASQVSIEYHASYFTNLGYPVAEDKRLISCQDPLYQGDCLTHRGYLFVGWNNTAENGAKVGTGAYVARIRYVVKVAGKVMESSGLDQVWGILRRN